jgi:hypothetical protein
MSFKRVPIIGEATKGQTVRLACKISRGILTVTGAQYELESLPGGRFILSPGATSDRRVANVEFGAQNSIDLTILLDDDVWIFGDSTMLSLSDRVLVGQRCIEIQCAQKGSSNLVQSHRVLSDTEAADKRRQDSEMRAHERRAN